MLGSGKQLCGESSSTTVLAPHGLNQLPSRTVFPVMVPLDAAMQQILRIKPRNRRIDGVA